MQDPNADTQWNDALRRHGILPEKEIEITEDELVNMVETTIQENTRGPDISEMTYEQLNEHEDSVDEDEEKIFEEYRRKRLAEMKATLSKEKYGEVIEISKVDYVREVNEAGDGVFVILHVYKQGMPLCTLINQHLSNLAKKFRATKFIRSISSVCIPNYPDKHLPTIFVYKEGKLLTQFIGPAAFGNNISIENLELMLSRTGAVKTDIDPDSQPKIKDVMESAIRESCISNKEGEENDW